jgi:hypothetical protein
VNTLPEGALPDGDPRLRELVDTLGVKGGARAYLEELR